MLTDPTSLTAIYAAVLATMAFGLELRRWFESGPRLDIRYMAPAIVIGGFEDDPKEYISITVSNNGNQPTTITHYLLYGYSGWGPYLLKRRKVNLIIPNPQYQSTELPHVLEAGKMWSGSAIYGARLKEELGKCSIWTVGIAYSSSRGAKMKRLIIKSSTPNQDAIEVPMDADTQ